MDWPTYYLARQLLSEEVVGSRLREIEREELAEFRQSARTLQERRR